MHDTEPRPPAFHLPAPALAAGVISITLVGLFVRLYGLTEYGLWFDEAYHIELVKLPSIWDMLDAVLSNPPSDPLYVLLLRGWVALFGTDAGSVRMLSAICGTATIPATFFLGRFSLGVGAGLGGALFFAISPYGIELGQEAALYSLAALTGTLCLAAGWRWISTGGRRISVYVLLGVIAIYSHYVVAAIIALFAALMLIFIIRDKALGRRWVLANGLILLSWLPWLVALILHWIGADLPRATLQHKTTIDEVLGGLVQFTSGTASLQQGVRRLELAGLASGFVLLAISLLLTSRNGKKGLSVMLLLFGLVYIGPAIVSAASGMWLFVPHFMLFLLPSLFVCLCAFLNFLPRVRTGWVRAACLFVVAGWIAVQSWGIVLFNQLPPHGADGLRELASVLTNENRKNEPVFVRPPALMSMLTQYYEGEIVGLPEDFDLRRVYIPFDPQDWYNRSMGNVENKVKGGASGFWLLYTEVPELDDGGMLFSMLQNRYTMLSERKYPFSNLYHFAVKP